MAMGMRQSFGLFMQPISQDIGISAGDFALAIAIQNMIWGLTQPFVGAIVDRYGARWVSIFGAGLFAIGLVVTAEANDAITILIGAGLIVGIALSCTTSGIASKIAVRAVRPERWSTAFGIISAAGSVGTFIAAPLAQTVIQDEGWRMAMIAFIGLVAVMVPAAFIGGRSDRVPNPMLGGPEQTLNNALGEARRHVGFIVMTTAFFVCGLQLVFLVTHLPTYLALCGIDPAVGAQALATIGAFNILGSWLFGWLGDRYSRRMLLGAVYLTRSALLATYFMLPPGQISTLVFAAAMGLLWLGILPLVNGLVAQIFGIQFLATLTGVAFMSHQFGSFLGAWGGGVILDTLGSYDLAWQLAVIIGVIAGSMQLFMDTRPTPRMQAQYAAAE